MPDSQRLVFSFPPFRLDPSQRLMTRDGQPISLTPKEFDTLVVLVEAAGAVVDKEELVSRVWPDSYVGDGSLARNISVLRKTLGEDVIQTHRGRGYRIALPVVETTINPVAITMPKQRTWGSTAGVTAALIALSVAGFGIYAIVPRLAPAPFQNFTMMQVTNSGRAASAAISPDGKFVLSVTDDNGLQSLWLRNVPSGSDTQVIPPSTSDYESLAFSPDGNYIYFQKTENALSTDFDLYRAPVLGGTPQRVIRDIDSDITFSPDGHRIAYARGNDPEIGKYRLLTATLDGDDEKVFQMGPSENIPDYLAWSPSGSQIAYRVLQPGSAVSGVDAFDIEKGKAHRLAFFDDEFVRGLSWSPDGQELFVNYSQRGPNFSRGQIGWLSRTGNLHPITRDTNGYDTLSVSANGKTLATIQTKATYSVYLLTGAGSQSAQVEPLPFKVHDIRGLNWTADGNLLASDGARLWRIELNGKKATQLVADPNALITYPSACGNRYVVFNWAFHEGTNANIWRANADGSDAVRITNGKRDFRAVCSPDQKWVYYYDLPAYAFARVPLDGSGKPEPVPRSSDPRWFYAYTGRARTWGRHAQMDISPDSKSLAFLVSLLDVRTQESTRKVAVLNLESATSPRLLDAHPHISGSVQFTPDGKAVAYPINENGVDNLWVQPLDGSLGHQITNFKSDQISSFHWSPDGKTLGLLREHSESDVVLIQDLEP